MRLTFRPIESGEITEASLLVDAAYAPQRRELYGDTRLGRWRHYEEAKIRGFIVREPEGVRVGVNGDRLIVFNVCRSYGSFGWFHTLAVHPDFHDKGFGQQAVSDAEAYLGARGVNAIALMTWPTAVKHLAFYRRLGYRVAGLSVYAYRTAMRPVVTGVSPFFASIYKCGSDATGMRTLEAIKLLSSQIYPGLDYQRWLDWTCQQDFAEVLLIWRDQQIFALAITYFFPGAHWAEGKLLLIHPGLNQAEHLWVLEHIRLWVRSHSRREFGLPTDIATDFAPQVLLANAFRFYPESMLNMVKGDDLPDSGLHFVRFGG